MGSQGFDGRFGVRLGCLTGFAMRFANKHDEVMQQGGIPSIYNKVASLCWASPKIHRGIRRQAQVHSTTSTTKLT